MDDQPYERISSREGVNPDTYDVENYDATLEKAKWRDLIAFFILGLINNYGYVVMLSAALDMLKKTHLSASVVLLADILPSFLIQLTAPWWMAKIPYSMRILFIVVSQIASFLIPALFSSVALKMIGVVCASLASGFGEITFLALTSFYNKQAVVAFSSGTGGAGIAGSVTYMGLRYFLDARDSLLVSSPIPLGIAVAYYIILSKPEVQNNADPVIMKPDEDVEQEQQNKLTLKQKGFLWLQLMKYMVPLFCVYFGEYLINQAIDEDLVFYNSKIFKGKNHQYTIYQAIYQVGVFISRSSAEIFPIKRLWIPAALQLVNAVFLSFVAVFGFIPSIWVIFVIILWEGLLGGAIYVNAFYLISQQFAGTEKEFCLGATSMSYGLSITIAAVVGIFYEPLLHHWSRQWGKSHHKLNK